MDIYKRILSLTEIEVDGARHVYPPSVARLITDVLDYCRPVDLETPMTARQERLEGREATLREFDTKRKELGL